MGELVTSLVGFAGSGVTYLTQHQLDRRRERREREREIVHAAGVARLLRDDFWRAQEAIENHCLRENSWWVVSQMRSDPSSADLRLIAGLLDWERWEAFSHGLAMLRELNGRRERAQEAGMPPLSAEDADFANYVSEALDGARAAIAELTGGRFRPHRLRSPAPDGSPAIGPRHPSLTRTIIARGDDAEEWFDQRGTSA